ncbi:thymidylate kinase [Arthrobacter sp. ISL-72]|uniref:thymidylate kinase n=1 Tax=Arthrobacter sp. ISL-72 TaxID=2819114 RepID=UPI001BE5025C|nr:thymidylate kinase [Arthrobacter sp. ISL-72]MBT2597245.1 thymidylate kinase [Arthrobacter sp. ISL-72]
MLIVLTGIDGAGKTTAARAAVEAARLAGRNALLLRNHAGRRNMTQWSARSGIPLHPRLADALETVIRTVNVLVSHARAHRFRGLVVMDRHLHCQLGLRSVRGLPRGRFLPWLLRRLPSPDLVIHFDIAPGQALERILLRGTDTETLEELTALSHGYRALPEYPGFLRIDAGGTQDAVLAALIDAIDGSRSNAGLQPVNAKQ